MGELDEHACHVGEWYGSARDPGRGTYGRASDAPTTDNTIHYVGYESVSVPVGALWDTAEALP